MPYIEEMEKRKDVIDSLFIKDVELKRFDAGGQKVKHVDFLNCKTINELSFKNS